MLLNRRISISYFIKQIRWQLVTVTIFALTVGFLHLQPGLIDIKIPWNTLGLIGTVVSLILAFRTAQSYERWWEARTVWGAIVNDSRTLVRDLDNFMPETEM